MYKDKKLLNNPHPTWLFVGLIFLMPLFCKSESICMLDAYLQQRKAQYLINIDSTFFDGYYIVLYTKKEIKDIIHNRQRELRGLSYKMAVDYYPIKYFVSKDEVFKKGFYNVIKDLPVRNKTRIFYECDKNYAEAFSVRFNLNIKDFTCNWPPLSNGGKHYTTKHKTKYCFNVYEVSGWFLKLKVDTEEKKDIMDRNIQYLQPGLKEFDAYYFLGYKSYSNDPQSLKGQIYVWRTL